MSTRSSQVAHLAGLVRAAIPKIHPGGRVIIGGVWGVSQLAALTLRAIGLKRLSRTMRRAGTCATVGAALFFRMPTRVPPLGAELVVAPADGVVSLISRAAPPPETGLGDAERTRVSIFLSVLDVHVQFAPVTGSVGAVHYHRGQFLSADLDKASDVNERNSVTIRPSVGGPAIVVTQIAGLIARRIVCDVAAGDSVKAGDVYGLIRFGSRLDVYLPDGAEPLVRLGQRAIGGETVLAALPVTKKAAPPSPDAPKKTAPPKKPAAPKAAAPKRPARTSGTASATATRRTPAEKPSATTSAEPKTRAPRSRKPASSGEDGTA